MRAVVLLLLLALAGPPAPVTYQPPVAAPIVDAFRPPTTPYGPGNRGLEYATEPGTPVRAAADGVVVFAGPVAGERYVTVLHDDGVRTTYAFLAQVTVAEGDEVVAGQVVGAAGARFLWTARFGDRYLDPAALLAASGVRLVRLVPDRPDLTRASPPRSPVSRAAAEWALGR